MLSRQTRSLLIPANAALLAHCQRVAALSSLVGHHLFLPVEQKKLLYSAALLHHSASGAFTSTALGGLLRDIYQYEVSGPKPFEGLPDELCGVLRAFKSAGSGSPAEKKLAEIARLADAFDQEMEALPLGGGTVQGIFQLLCDGTEGGLWSSEVFAALRDSTNPQDLPSPSNWRIPVFPTAAVRVLHLLDDPYASVSPVIEAARSDPGIAALLMRLANSALFGSATSCSTLRQAIVRLGFNTARKAILAATLRPLFVSNRLEGLWQHSVEVGDLVEQLAAKLTTLDPAEAFVTGLLHDTGRIALLECPLYHCARLEGLVRIGCPPVYAENLLLHTDHAALGGRMAAAWNLPERMAAPIAAHHRPETVADPLADILYLAEYLTGEMEDLPSSSRLDVALRGVGITVEELVETTISGVGSLLAA